MFTKLELYCIPLIYEVFKKHMHQDQYCLSLKITKFHYALKPKLNRRFLYN
jgi:hypothetical protein